MSVVVRRVVGAPVRTAAEVWAIIADLVAAQGTAARQELDRVAGIVMSLIAGETMGDSPIVIYGVGPRLRVYCLYGEAAVLGENASEDALLWTPTDGDWAMSLPSAAEDLPWIQRALARASARVTARDKAEMAPGEEQVELQKTSREIGPVNQEAFLRP